MQPHSEAALARILESLESPNRLRKEGNEANLASRAVEPLESGKQSDAAAQRSLAGQDASFAAQIAEGDVAAMAFGSLQSSRNGEYVCMLDILLTCTMHEI